MEPVGRRKVGRSGWFWRGWAGAVLMGGGLVGLASLPPLLSEGAYAALMHGFAPFCHQMPGRSPYIDGVQLAVGHRCYGLYGGVLLGALLFPLAPHGLFRGRWPGALLIACGLPAAVDWSVTAVLGLWENTPFSRMATGLLFGAAAGLLLARALTQAAQPADTARKADAVRIS